jgi:hypothetical protein
MNHREIGLFWARAKYSCNYLNRNTNFSTRRIISVLPFLIMVITSFSLTVLGLKVLTLSDESYIICEASGPVLKVEERRLI